MTVLIAGGTGLLGARVVDRLTKLGTRVRVLTRSRARGERLRNDLVEVVEGDVRDSTTLGPAVADVTTVISSFHGLTDPQSDPEHTDHLGNVHLIDAAKSAGVEHYILVSAWKSTPDSPMALARAKYAAEQYLKASGLAWTILQPSAFMEFWANLLGQPVLDTGKTRVFGRGDNPINFVSIEDVAVAVERAVTDPALRGVELELTGPEDLTFNQVVEAFARLCGAPAKVSHVPRPALRMMSVLMRPFNPVMARLAGMAILNDTLDLTPDASAADQDHYPWLPKTSLQQMIARRRPEPAGP